MNSASSFSRLFCLVVCLVVWMAGCRTEQQSDVTPENENTATATLPQDELPVVPSAAAIANAPDQALAKQKESRGNVNSTTAMEEEQLPDLEQALAASSQRDLERQNGDAAEPQEVQTIEIPPTWKRLSQQQEVWLDMKNKQVIAGGHICMNAGPLEVFVCPRYTKEHESVVSVNALSSQIHAALLALGAEPGHPVKWEDEYQPAKGPVVEITIMWKDDQENQIIKRRGQEMVRNVVTDKIMQQDWVFGGSQVYTDPESGESFYYGDSGELVCLSNFSTATMDVPVQSSDANDGLLFAANSPRIPPVGTKVYVVFQPQVDQQKE